MVSSLGEFYPGGSTNPHLEIHVFNGGRYLAPKAGESDAAYHYQPEHPVIADENPTQRTVGGMALATSMAEVYEL